MNKRILVWLIFGALAVIGFISALIMQDAGPW